MTIDNNDDENEDVSGSKDDEIEDDDHDDDENSVDDDVDDFDHDDGSRNESFVRAKIYRIFKR